MYYINVCSSVIYMAHLFDYPFFISSWLTAQPYNAEFYFDTPNPVRILKGNNYSYNLQWTQREPQATDRIIGYWLSVQKVKYSSTNICKQQEVFFRLLCSCAHKQVSILMLLHMPSG